MDSPLIPYIRILLGYLGVFLASRGVDDGIVDLISNDPALAELILGVAGGFLILVQIVWWKLAQAMNWSR